MLIAAKNIATAPKMLLNVTISPLISTTCKIAPTTTIPEIAFVTDISGVCNAGVTFQTTWYPTKIARIKILMF